MAEGPGDKGGSVTGATCEVEGCDAQVSVPIVGESGEFWLCNQHQSAGGCASRCSRGHRCFHDDPNHSDLHRCGRPHGAMW